MGDVYQTVTDKIVAALAHAERWQKPWTSAFIPEGGTGLQRPRNAINGKPYNGINVPLLWSAGRASNHWATYNAWSGAGAQVRKGEKATQIVFWKQLSYADPGESGEDTKRNVLMARLYSVFNAEQVDGWKKEAPSLPAPTTTDDDALDVVDAYIAKTGASVRHGGDKAYYVPSVDFIQMPPRAAFIATKTSTAQQAYYSTLFHELTHWTGHTSRNARNFANRFGDEAYAAEELVAELGAAFFCADHLMIHEPRADHANYLANWLRVLKGDKRAIFTAASKAEAAVRFCNDATKEDEHAEPQQEAA